MSPAFTKRQWTAAALLALIVLVVGSYFSAARCDFISLDDGLFVTRNPHVRSGLQWENVRWAFTNVEAANWHPLTWISHMLDCEVFGLRPGGHHVVNVLFHLSNTLIVFCLLLHLTGFVGRSFCVASLFGLHPLRVESVAWVAERKDVLSAFFYLLALVAYERYAAKRKSEISNAPQTGKSRKRQTSPSDNKPRAEIYYFLTLILFVLALLSKPMAVTLPAVLLLLDYWPLRRVTLKGPSKDERGSIQRYVPLLVEKLPFIGLGFAAGIVTLIGQHRAGAMTLEGLPLTARFGNALISIWRYLGKTLWPTDLAVFYPYKTPGLLFVLGAAVGVVAFSILAFRLRKTRPHLAVGWAWYVIALLPVIGIVQVGAQAMADRYTYLPSIGVFMLITWEIAERSARMSNRLPILTAMQTAVVLTCATLTKAQVGYWRNSETLFRHAADSTKENWMAQCNLGIALNQRGELAEAIAQFRESLKWNPDYAVARQNLGAALLFEGNTGDAILQLREAVRLKPDYALAHCNLGAALKREGRLDEAIAEFEQAVKLRPADAESHYDLAVVLRSKGRRDEALQELKQALRYEPGFSRAKQALDELERGPARAP